MNDRDRLTLGLGALMAATVVVLAGLAFLTRRRCRGTDAQLKELVARFVHHRVSDRAGTSYVRHDGCQYMYPRPAEWTWLDSRVVKDAWGRPLRLEVPGPVHREGWDLYSYGPNGLDERGGGDDLLVGGDEAILPTDQTRRTTKIP